MKIEEYVALKLPLLERELRSRVKDEVFPEHREHIKAALRGGKRLRPVLCLLACEALTDRDASLREALSSAISIEMTHNASLVRGTLVFGNPEVKPIEAYQPGDKLYTFKDGGLRPTEAVAAFCTGFAPIYLLRTNTRSIAATGEHLFLVHESYMPRLEEASRETRRRWSLGLVKKARPRHRLVWKTLLSLKPGDLILAVRALPDHGAPLELPAPPPFRYLRKRITIPREMNEDLAEICGFLLGDGYVSVGKLPHQIILYIPPSDKELEGRLRQLFLRTLGLKLKRNRHMLYASSIEACWLFSYLGVTGKAKQKAIPRWIFGEPLSHKVAFVRGLIESDGTVGRYYIGYTSVSHELVRGLKALLHSIGFHVSNIYHWRARNRWPNSKTTISNCWTIRIERNDRTEELLGISGSPYYHTNGNVRILRTLHLDPSTFTFEIVKALGEAGRGPVYDIQVRGSNNFVAEGLIVHNSLIQDDVLDRTGGRRGEVTLAKRIGVAKAILTSNLLLSQAVFATVSSGSLEAARTLAEVWNKLSRGAIRELEGEGAYNREGYYELVRLKTGSLFGAAAKAGAIATGSSPKAQDLFFQYGLESGVAFQLADDLADARLKLEEGEIEAQVKLAREKCVEIGGSLKIRDGFQDLLLDYPGYIVSCALKKSKGTSA